MRELTEGLLQIRSQPIWYQEAGMGPAILLLHAGVADHRMWRHQIEPLGDRHRVVAWDAPGFGKSPLAPGEFSYAQAILDLMDALAINQATLVGCSMGGSAAIRATLSAPGRVSGLVLVGSGVHGFHSDLPEPDIYAQCGAAEETGDWQRLIELEAQVWLAGLSRTLSSVPPDLLSLYREMNRDHYLFAWNQDAVPIDDRTSDLERLREISAPTLIVTGDEDIPEIEAQAVLIAERIPGATRSQMAKCAHLLPLERPVEFNSILLDWLATRPVETVAERLTGEGGDESERR